jgi:hypothetical protein
MELLKMALNSGTLPENYLELLEDIPPKEEQKLRLFYEKAEKLLYNVFLGGNEQLFNSFINILWSYSDLDEYELEEIKHSKEDKSRFATILSTFKDYYFCTEGFRVLVVNSYSSISYSYLVGESVLHVYDLEEDRELGIIQLASSTSRELISLSQSVIKWTKGRPLFANGGVDVYLSDSNG